MKGNGTQTDNTQPVAAINDVYQEIDFDTLTLDELKALATDDYGIDWSQSGHQNREAKARETARKNTRAPVPKWVRKYQNFWIGIGNIVIMTVMLIIQSVLVVLAIPALSVAEIVRAAQGVRLFDANNAYLMSVIMIVFYLGLLSVEYHNDVASKVKVHKFSLRFVAQDIGYFFGRGAKRKQYRSLDKTRWQDFMAVKNATRRLIVFLSTAGTLSDDVAPATGNELIDNAVEGANTWYGQLWETGNGELNTVLALAGGFFLSMVLMRGFDWVYGYNYMNFKGLGGGVDFLSGSSDTLAAENDAARQYVIATMRKAEQKRRR